MNVKPSEIKIGRRIRSDLGDLKELSETFDKVGLLQPIAITPKKELIFGERRLKAWKKKYGEKPIEVRILDLDGDRKRLAELIENVQRKDLPWRDEQRAIAGVDRFGRRIFGEHTPGGSPQKHSSDSEKWDEEKTARLLNISVPAVSDAKLLTETMKHHPEVVKKKTKSSALKLARKLSAKEKGEERKDWLRYYTVWNFQESDPTYVDPNFPTALPAQIIQNLLYYFTEPNDLVIDPMAGSGLVERVAKDMGRKCESYDINPRRDFIKYHDIQNGIPNIEKGDFTFLDPPYFNMINYGTDVERGNIEEFYEFMNKIAGNAEKMKGGAKIAYITCDLTTNRKPPHLLTLELFYIFKQHGLTPIANISCPLTPAQFRADEMKQAKVERQMLGLVRNIVVFEKKEINQ